MLPVGKHHDGFPMWDARDTSPGWNAVELGPKRDVLTALYNASEKAGLPFGIYCELRFFFFLFFGFGFVFFLSFFLH